MGEDTAAELQHYYPRDTGPDAEETQLAKRSTGVLSWATALTITTDADLAEADVAQGRHDEFQKRVEAFFRPNITRWHEGHKAACESFNGVNDPLKEAKRISKGKMGFYQQEQARQRAAEQHRREEAARKAAEEQQLLEAEVLEDQGRPEDADLVINQEVVAPVVAPPPPLLKTKTRLTTTWQFEILAPELVPRELCRPDPALIRQRLRSTTGKPIPGVRHWKQKA